MSHSNIVKDLLHKLSKNEVLSQDGGNYRNYRNQRHYNKARQYRNQLKSLYESNDSTNDSTSEDIASNLEEQLN